MSDTFTTKSLRTSLALTPKTLRLAWQSAPALTLTLVILTLIAAGLPLALAYVGKSIIDAVVSQHGDATLRQVLLELALVVVMAGVSRGLGLARQLLGARLSVDINLMILVKAQTLDLHHFEDATFYDQLVRARREASSRPVGVVTDTFQLLQNVLTLGGYIALLLNYNAWAVVGLFFAAFPGTLSEMHFSTAAFRLRNRRSPETRRLNYVEHVLANDDHAKEVKLFDLGPHLLQRYKDIGDQLFREDRRLSVVRTAWAYGLSLIGTGAFYGCYGALALAAAAGRITLGELTLYAVALRQGQQSFQSSLSAVGSMYESNLYMSNLFGYLAIPTTPPRALQPAAPTAASVLTEKGIRFDDVGFQYPGQSAWALQGIRLFIPAGQSLALVGHNGAGKTTLIKLLTRLYHPTSGRILLDGVDLQDWDVDRLRRRIGVVFQDFNKYQFSFGDNVGFGSLDHLDNEERLLRAIDLGGAGSVLNSLPQGLATPLGRWFKEGQELSGGQWQKIALARAFMREDADILVLDEPTAALDPEAEYAVFERFRALTRGRTAILISHRFPTVRMADQIVVIEGGKLLELGSHADLVAKGGRYAELFALQARGYL